MNLLNCLSPIPLGLTLIAAPLLLAASAHSEPLVAFVAPYESTVKMQLNFIRQNDPTAFLCLEYNGIRDHQVWDKRNNDESVLNAFSFTAFFNDQPPIEFITNPEFKTVDSSRESVLPVAEALGRVYRPLRLGIGRVAIHKGNKGFHAGGYTNEHGQIVLYTETIQKRIEQKHLEESLFHESVHATLDRHFAPSPAWLQAQATDQRFITSYAAATPQREDLAETALLVYADMKHPDRMPSEVSLTLNSTVPNRVKILRALVEYTDKNLPAEFNKASCN